MSTALPAAPPAPSTGSKKADYDIKCELDEANLKLTGSEVITYFNNSPNTLTYLWLQMDENEHSTVNNANYQNSRTMGSQLNTASIDQLEESRKDNGYGFNITKMVDALGKPMKYTVNKTMMRVELAAPLKARTEVCLHHQLELQDFRPHEDGWPWWL